MTYLDQGGNLYIEGVDIGVDHAGSDFFGYLGVCYEYNGHDFDVDELLGQGTIMTNLNYLYQGGEDPHYSVDWLGPCEANTLFSCEDGIPRMFVYEADNYKVVSSSIVLGALANGDYMNQKPYLLSEIVNYFLGITVITSLTDIANNNIHMTSYPNPFSEKTRIDYSVETSSNVVVEIMNQNGQVIKQLVSTNQSEGEHSVTWDGTSEPGERVSGGVYFYTIRIGNRVSTGKLVLL